MKNDEYRSAIKKEILRFKKLPVNPATIIRFLDKINSAENLTKEVNKDEHICAFFVPFDRKAGKIYLGHHIKADDWIPPGGHIRFPEHPMLTVIREFEEELDVKITPDTVSRFNLSVKDISANPRNPCRIHYDFWYIVDVPVTNFRFLKKEFYDAGWFTIDQAVGKIRTPEFNRIVRTMSEIL